MGEKKVWLVTGAGRGLGVDIARAALAAGHAVVATGRNTEKVSAGSGSTTTFWRSSWTSPIPPTERRPSRRRSTGSAGSTCWSTTPATSTPASSRN